MRFESGSMAAKVEAACGFVEAPDGAAGIGALGETVALVCGEAGIGVPPSRDRDDDGSGST